MFTKPLPEGDSKAVMVATTVVEQGYNVPTHETFWPAHPTDCDRGCIQQIDGQTADSVRVRRSSA